MEAAKDDERSTLIKQLKEDAMATVTNWRHLSASEIAGAVYRVGTEGILVLIAVVWIGWTVAI